VRVQERGCGCWGGGRGKKGPARIDWDIGIFLSPANTHTHTQNTLQAIAHLSCCSGGRLGCHDDNGSLGKHAGHHAQASSSQARWPTVMHPLAVQDLSHTPESRTTFCSPLLSFFGSRQAQLIYELVTPSLRRTLLCSAVRIQAREYVQSRGQRVGKVCKGGAAPLAVKGERTETRASVGQVHQGRVNDGKSQEHSKSCNVFVQFPELVRTVFSPFTRTLGLRTVWRTPSPACAAVMGTCGCCYALMHLGCVAVLAVVRLHGVPVWNGKCAFSSPKLSRPPHTHTTGTHTPLASNALQCTTHG
jgi:hypothetical protein